MRRVPSSKVRERAPGECTAWATDLGWRDDLPLRAETALGSGQPLVAVHVERRGKTLRWVDYRQPGGDLKLRIFNE